MRAKFITMAVKQIVDLNLQYKKGMVNISYNNSEPKNKIRATLYARVSSDRDPYEYTLENQFKLCDSEVKKHPEWELIGKYIDECIAGTSAKKRPKFLKMFRDAKDGKFDLIITRDISCFARNTVDTLRFTRELKAMGIEIFFINDGLRTFDPDGELRLAIMSCVAQEESRRHSERVKAGIRAAKERKAKASDENNTF